MVDARGWTTADLENRVVVIGDDTLAIAVREEFALSSVTVFDDLTVASAPAPDGVVRSEMGESLFTDVRLVVAELPKANAELDEWAWLLAVHGDDPVFVGAGRDKHMSRGLNEQLAHSFGEVSASRGVRKARALRATTPHSMPRTAAYPRIVSVADLPFDVTAHGGAFAGGRLDLGTRALLDALDGALEKARIPQDSSGTAVDLGSGTGILATSVALRRPEMTVIASDLSWAAAASTRATAIAAGVGDRVQVVQEDSLAGIADGSVDLVVFNPPFHDGHAVDERLAHTMFASAARVLRPGGSIVCVFNSHLPHRAALNKLIGHTQQLTRNEKFTVTLSRRRDLGETTLS